MRRFRRDMWYKALVVWMCILLAASGVPTMPVHAEETTSDLVGWSGEFAQADAETTSGDAAAPAASDVPTTSEDAEEAPASDVTVRLGDAAQADAETTSRDGATPAGSGTTETETADLDCEELPSYASGMLSQETKDGAGHRYEVRVSYGADACIPEGSELRVRMPDVAKGSPLEDEAAHALALDDADRLLDVRFVEAWIEAEGCVVEPQEEVAVTIETDAIEAARSDSVEVVGNLPGNVSPETSAVGDASAALLASQNVTEEDGPTKLSFDVGSLGTMALASVVTQQGAWEGDGLEVSLLAPREGLIARCEEAEVLELDEGKQLVAAYSVLAEPVPAHGETLWLEARAIEDADDEASANDDVRGYRIAKGILVEEIFDATGTKEPVAVSANEDGFAIVLDGSPLRDEADSSDDTDDTDDADEPVATTAADPIAASTMDDTATPVTLSTNFSIRAVAKTYARSAKVLFVDEGRNPINGTVTGVHTVTYTGTGSETNETNTIDMYSYVDKLDPSIADEYEFSRVFVQLSQAMEKDFRYVQVADETAIISGGNTSTYRAYLYMDSIDQSRPGQDYYGTWYQLSNGGALNDLYIEYYHVAPASFFAIDSRNDPVESAEFALYTDDECYTPFEYKGTEITATSGRDGKVSFGKIPRGTYYMKETVIPEGYKKSTNVYTVVVDGETPIANVMHEDDDGSVIIADVLEMTFTKEWDDGKDHTGDSVVVTIYANGEVQDEVTLSASNQWTQTLTGLDPNESYMVSETQVTSGGADVTSSWIPLIEYEEKDPHVEYHKADSFRKGKQYVVLTKTYGGTRALAATPALTTTPLAANADGTEIVGDVTDAMLWDVETFTQDGVIALRNVGTNQYLDQSSRWYLNPSYPVPLYVRQINRDGQIRFYHRANINLATPYYLYIWYGPSKEGQVDRYASNENQAGVFELYRKVNVRSVDVTVTNKATRYPVRMRNVTYPQGDALPGMTFDLYAQEGGSASGTPVMSSLTAGADGYLRSEGEAQLELSAGTYLLEQTGDTSGEGYEPLSRPLKFTITRGGALRVSMEDRDFDDFAYVTTMQDGSATLPVLQVPHMKPATVEVSLEVEGAYADLTRTFEFRLLLPKTVDEVRGSIDGRAVTLTPENDTFRLSHGQTLRLDDIPASESYVIVQTEDTPYETSAEAKTSTVTVRVDALDPRRVTLADLAGTTDAPARVSIVNSLPNESVPPTGIADNTTVWAAVVCACAVAILVVWRMPHVLRRRR